MKTMNKIRVLGVTTTLLGSLAGGLKAQTFADWTTTPGNTSGTGNFGNLGTVLWNITYLSNSNGIGPVDSGPRALGGFEGNLDTFGSFASVGRNGLQLNAGRIDATDNTNIGYVLTFTFTDGAGSNVFPSNEPVFYIGDVDSGDFRVDASLAGNSLSVNDWYVGAAQTDDLASRNGIPSTWNGTSLIGQGLSEFFVHQFKPTEDFDTISLTYTNGAPLDSITFGVGDVVAPIPEPSSAILLGIGCLGALARRKRV